MKDIQHNVAEIRAEIERLHVERAHLRAQKRSRKEIQEHVDQKIDAWRRVAEERAARNVALLAHGETPSLLAAGNRLSAEEGHHADLAPLLVALCGADQVRTFLLASLDDIPAIPCAEAKAQRLMEIEARLVDLETREESLIVASENAGQPIARRLDARPEIVLALQP